MRKRININYKTNKNKINYRCDVTIIESKIPSRKEILEKSKGVDGIFWATADDLDAEAYDAAGSNLKVVSTYTVGFDYVDVEEAKKRKILLGNTPGVLNDSVADIAIGLLIAAARRFHEARLLIEKYAILFKQTSILTKLYIFIVINGNNDPDGWLEKKYEDQQLE